MDECDGSGWIIVNAAWPNGTDVYRRHCSGCGMCDPELTPDAALELLAELRREA